MKPSPEARCPYCQHGADAAVPDGHGTEERREALDLKMEPVPGSWTVCIRCGAVLRFTSGMTVRLAHRHEIRELPTWMLQLLSAASKMAKRMWAEKN